MLSVPSWRRGLVIIRLQLIEATKLSHQAATPARAGLDRRQPGERPLDGDGLMEQRVSLVTLGVAISFLVRFKLGHAGLGVGIGHNFDWSLLTVHKVNLRFWSSENEILVFCRILPAEVFGFGYRVGRVGLVIR